VSNFGPLNLCYRFLTVLCVALILSSAEEEGLEEAAPAAEEAEEGQEQEEAPQGDADAGDEEGDDEA
jgi:hypothetical protein